MKKALIILALVANTAMADWRDPFESVSMDKNFTNNTQLTIRPVPNDKISLECHKERIKRGFPSEVTPVLACSFWEPKSCTIIVGKNTSRDTLGHELQHCLQGNYH